ncbi:MAG: glycosyltransferase family 2 protein, partial [Microcystis panniformis]
AEMKQGLPTPPELRNRFHTPQNSNNSNSHRPGFVSLKGKAD